MARIGRIESPQPNVLPLIFTFSFRCFVSSISASLSLGVGNTNPMQSSDVAGFGTMHNCQFPFMKHIRYETLCRHSHQHGISELATPELRGPFPLHILRTICGAQSAAIILCESRAVSNASY